MIKFVKNKFMGLEWVPQNGSQKLFYNFNIVKCFEISKCENKFLWIVGYFLKKPLLKMWFNGLSFIPKVIVVKELWSCSFDAKEKYEKLF